MKKKACIVLLLSLSLCLSACAQKTGRSASIGGEIVTDTLALVEGESSSEEIVIEETLAPLKEIKPTVNLSDNSVGNFVSFPSSVEGLEALQGSDVVTFYFEKPDVTAGDGLIGLYDAQSDALVSSVSVKDSTLASFSMMDENGKTLSGWESGTMADITFPDFSFESGKSYYILMDEGAFCRGEIKSKALTDKEALTILVKDYGFNGLISSMAKVGDTIDIPYVLGDSATSIELREYDLKLLSSSLSVGDSRKDHLTLSCLSPGEASFRVFFLNGDNVLDTTTFNVTITN